MVDLPETVASVASSQVLNASTSGLVRSWRTLGYLECDLTDAQGQLVARAACTQMILHERGG